MTGTAKNELNRIREEMEWNNKEVQGHDRKDNRNNNEVLGHNGKRTSEDTGKRSNILQRQKQNHIKDRLIRKRYYYEFHREHQSTHASFLVLVLSLCFVKKPLNV